MPKWQCERRLGDCKNCPGKPALAKDMCDNCYKKAKRKEPGYKPAKRSKEQERKDNLYRLHRMRLDEYQHLYDSQGGVCAICSNRETARSTSGAVRMLSVDHDHATNINRGLLCSGCNTALGLFKEDIGRLESAVRYLIQYQQRG
jgi:hypothetical protein